MPKRTRRTRYRSIKRRRKTTKRGGKVSNRKRTRKTKRKTRKTRKSRIPRGKRCSDLLSEKIKINMKEYKRGKFVSRAQAIAVAYKQVGDEYPSCKPVFTKRRNKMSRRK